jgi:hypothetical protein
VPWIEGGLAVGALLAVVGALAFGGRGGGDEGPIAIPLGDRGTPIVREPDAGVSATEAAADAGSAATAGRAVTPDAGARERESERAGATGRDASGQRASSDERASERTGRTSPTADRTGRRPRATQMRTTMRASRMTETDMGVPLADEFGF